MRDVKLQIRIEVILISLFLSLFVLFTLFADYNFSLSNLSHLYISQATIDDVDVGKRIVFFYQLLLSFSLLFPLIYYTLIVIKKKLSLTSDNIIGLSVISFIGIFSLFSYMVEVSGEKPIKLFLVVLCIRAGFLFFKHNKGPIKLIATNHFFIKVSLWVIIFISVLLFSVNNFIIKHLYFTVFLSYTIIGGLLILIRIALNQRLRNYNNLITLLFLPLLLLFASEFLIYNKLQYSVSTSFIKTFLLSTFIFLLIELIYRSIKKIKINSRKYNQWLIISSLLSFLVTTLYSPFVTSGVDMFELANPANAQMRIFLFNEFPFIDFFSSHLLSEQFYGIIYHLIFGYTKGLDFLSYSFLYDLLLYFIVFFFVKRLFNNSFLALLFLIFFPLTIILFGNHIAFSIIVFFSAIRVVKSQTIKNYVFLYLLIILSCFWRLDVGVSVILSTLFFILLIYYTESIKVNLKKVITSLSIVLSVLIIAFLITISFRNLDYILTHIKVAFEYIIANQAHGYSKVYLGNHQGVFIFHFLLPLTSILCILVILYQLRLKRETLSLSKKFILRSALFFFLIFIFNFQRGIVRHSFIENVDTFLSSTYYLAMALFIMSFINVKSSYHKFLSFSSISLGLILLIKFFPINKEQSLIDKFSNSTIANQLLKTDYNNRLREDVELIKNNNQNIIKFFDDNLLPNQTFLDFSNNPMLYYYSQRKIPSYFCQSLQNSVSSYLQNFHLSLINPKNTPIVVYSNYPPNWWDNTDGVLNSMRYTKIAEYIYENYIPYGIIDNYSIMIDKNLRQSSLLPIDTLIRKPKTHHYKYAAKSIAIYASNKPSNFKLIRVVDQSDLTTFDIDSMIAGKKGNYLKFYFNKVKNNQEIEITIHSDNQLIGKVNYTTTLGYNEYMVPISNHYLWYKDKPKTININVPNQNLLNKIEFYKHIP